MTRRSAYLLILSVAVLLVVGVVMLFSTSAYQPDNKGDIYHFLKKQSAWLGLGLVACTVASRLDYHFWERVRWPLFGVSVVGLGLCFVPGVGSYINGSHRWVRFGPLGFQPSDLAKLASVLTLAGWAARRADRHREFLQGLAFPGALAGVLMVGVLAEPDLGTTLLLGGVTVAMLFVAGCRVVYLLAIGAAGGGAVYLIARQMGNRNGRMLAFRDLEKYRHTFGHQQWEGLQAFATGGVSGQGLGESVEKMRYLPYAHTDFIFPIVGEELGLRVTLIVVLAFALIAVSGVLIANSARDRFGLLLAFGLTMTIVLQAAVNIGVTTALLPNKGMPLPFISSGGSNLCLCLLFVGILLNVYRQGGRLAPVPLRGASGSGARPVGPGGQRPPEAGFGGQPVLASARVTDARLSARVGPLPPGPVDPGKAVAGAKPKTPAVRVPARRVPPDAR